MKRMTREREAKNLSRTKLGYGSLVHPSRIGSIENGRVLPYPVELGRIAAALEWEGDPELLLEEVDDHAG